MRLQTHRYLLIKLPKSDSERHMIMMDELDQTKRAGTFTISPDKDVFGELTLAGPNTSLYLRDNQHFDTHAIPGQCVKGILLDLTKVTLIQCITTLETGSAKRRQGEYNFARIFPHYVVFGDGHIAPYDRSITEVSFVVDDASTLFYDFDAFGSLTDARPYIEQIAHANHLEREIPIGPYPQILYFTGKREIFAADTILGRVSASHNPSHDLGGPNGVSMKNTILVTITYREAVTFGETIAHTSTLLRYLGILVGRPQNLLRLNLRVEGFDMQPSPLRVYCSMSPKRKPSYDDQRPHPADVLLDAVRHPEAFSLTLKLWLDRQQTWHDARMGFSNSFAHQNHYSNDRLIGSANMFDILPDSAVPPGVELSEELKCATESCRTIFKKLPISQERDIVLNALGRVGKSTLKRKIRHRGKLLIDILGQKFPDLFKVTDEAVICRNHYVHGSEPTFDYSNEFGAVIFFTDTLEFVFAASDLIEAGWDVKAWSEIPSSMSHPFGRYRINYSENLRKLQALLAKPAVT